MMNTKLKLIASFYMSSVFLLSACNGSDSRSVEPDPARIHENDEVVVNDDGTSSVTLANRNFTTSQFVMNDDGHASKSTLSFTDAKSYDIGDIAKNEIKTLANMVEVTINQAITIHGFAVKDNVMFARVKSDITTQLDTQIPNIFIKNGPDFFTLNTERESEFNGLLSVSLTSKKVISSIGASSAMTDFSFNGAILTANDSAQVSFYEVDASDNTFGDVFPPIKPLGDSGKIDGVFLDHNRYYVLSGDTVYSMPLDDVSNHRGVATLIDSDITTVDQVYFAADELYVYVAVVDGTKTKVQRIDKANQISSDWGSVLHYKTSGIAVDASHVYLTDSIVNTPVINAYKISGDFVDDAALPTGITVGAIHLEGSTLYYINKADKTLHQTTINWAP